MASGLIEYPTEFEEAVILPNRTALRIRALRQCDETPIRELDQHLSVQARYQRFLSPMHVLPDSLIRLLACVDYRRSLALVAEHDAGNGRDVLGLASFAAIDDDVAEVGLLVRDDWQRQRIGTELAARILIAAELRGLHRFIAHMFSDNIAIRQVLQRVGDVVRTTIRGNTLQIAFVRRKSTSLG
jgi:acetyltransferase